MCLCTTILGIAHTLNNGILFLYVIIAYIYIHILFTIIVYLQPMIGSSLAVSAFNKVEYSLLDICVQTNKKYTLAAHFKFYSGLWLISAVSSSNLNQCTKNPYMFCSF